MKNSMSNVSVLAKIKSMPIAVKIISGVAATCLTVGAVATVVTVSKNNEVDNLETTSARTEITESVDNEIKEDEVVTDKDESATDMDATEAPESVIEDDKTDVSEDITNPTVNTPSTNKPSENKPAESKPTESKPTESKPTDKPTENKPTEKPAEKPTESKPENNTPSVIPTRDLLDGAYSLANDAYLSLGYFEDTSKVSMKDAADFIYWTSINIYNKEWHDIDGNWFWVEVPMSEFNEASVRYFGRTYNFKELDGQSLIISPYFPMEDDVRYDASKDALIITCSYGGGGGDTFDFPTKELKVIDDNTCTLTMTYTQTTTKAPTMDIPYEVVTYEYDCLTYYKYITVEDITLTYVDGHWQYVSYVPVSY